MLGMMVGVASCSWAGGLLQWKNSFSWWVACHCFQQHLLSSIIHSGRDLIVWFGRGLIPGTSRV